MTPAVGITLQSPFLSRATKFCCHQVSKGTPGIQFNATVLVGVPVLASLRTRAYQGVRRPVAGKEPYGSIGIPRRGEEQGHLGSTRLAPGINSGYGETHALED
jgi:hypothetical protein